MRRQNFDKTDAVRHYVVVNLEMVIAKKDTFYASHFPT